MSERLVDFGKRLKKVLQDADTGPLQIAGEVVAISENWNLDEAEGLSCTSWLRKHLGPGHGLGWFKARHAAVKALGDEAKRTLHHEVAVWVTNNVPDGERIEIFKLLIRATKKQNDVILTPAQARKLIEATGGGKFVKRRGLSKCSKCQELQTRIYELETMLGLNKAAE